MDRLEFARVGLGSHHEVVRNTRIVIETGLAEVSGRILQGVQGEDKFASVVKGDLLWMIHHVHDDSLLVIRVPCGTSQTRKMSRASPMMKPVVDRSMDP